MLLIGGKRMAALTKNYTNVSYPFDMPTNEPFSSKSMMYLELDIEQLNRLQMFNDRLKSHIDNLPRNSTGKRSRYFEQVKVMELFIQQNIKKFI